MTKYAYNDPDQPYLLWYDSNFIPLQSYKGIDYTKLIEVSDEQWNAHMDHHYWILEDGKIVEGPRPQREFEDAKMHLDGFMFLYMAAGVWFTQEGGHRQLYLTDVASRNHLRDLRLDLEDLSDSNPVATAEGVANLSRVDIKGLSLAVLAYSGKVREHYAAMLAQIKANPLLDCGSGWPSNDTF